MCSGIITLSALRLGTTINCWCPSLFAIFGYMSLTFPRFSICNESVVKEDIFYKSKCTSLRWLASNDKSAFILSNIDFNFLQVPEQQKFGAYYPLRDLTKTLPALVNLIFSSKKESVMEIGTPSRLELLSCGLAHIEIVLTDISSWAWSVKTLTWSSKVTDERQ